MRAAVRGRSPYADFFRDDHPSRAVEITERICCELFSIVHDDAEANLVVAEAVRERLSQFWQR